MSIDQAKMPEWVKVWGPVVVILGAMWAMIGRSESRLGARIDRLEDRVAENRQAIETNLQAIIDLGREVSELRGELKGRDLLLAEEDR